MFKTVHWLGLSLTLAGICTLPALADVTDAQKTEGPARPAFSDIDTNSDGVISQAEFDAFRPKRPDGDHGRGREHDGPRGRGGPMPFHGADLKRLDTDKDGKVSFDEFSAPMKAHFARMDTNKDGFLDEAELKAPPPPPEGGPDGDGPPPPPEK
ncbi:EF-hand domain-containing protein [Asticcacaulis sp.]|uniref:EF-hand domain-containing protein n=1 Tax=Asticcacaulis sp. TaxID=1872648 RepID=UPI002CEF22C6|nr:EF-hand domain-containing protein [Asticcacaulis sp.]HTM82139.1 EF-hand domain-containing protein [Asticcacaulis sp.]